MGVGATTIGGAGGAMRIGARGTDGVGTTIFGGVGAGTTTVGGVGTGTFTLGGAGGVSGVGNDS